jgi:hypothetical protein
MRANKKGIQSWYKAITAIITKKMKVRFDEPTGKVHQQRRGQYQSNRRQTSTQSTGQTPTHCQNGEPHQNHSSYETKRHVPACQEAEYRHPDSMYPQKLDNSTMAL